MCKCDPNIKAPFCYRGYCVPPELNVIDTESRVPGTYWHSSAPVRQSPVLSLKTLEDCIVFAVKAHEGQKDKIGEPYIFHPLRVMESLNDQASRMTAILHDVVEDTSWEPGDLEKLGLREDVLTAVKMMTRDKTTDYWEYLSELAYDHIALRVKIADIRDNMSPARLYKLEHATRERLTRKYLDALRFLESHQNV